MFRKFPEIQPILLPEFHDIVDERKYIVYTIYKCSIYNICINVDKVELYLFII